MGLGDAAFHIGNAEVGAGNFLDCSEPRMIFADLGHIHDAFFKDLVARIEQPFLSFGVCGGYRPVKCRKKDHTSWFHSATPSYS